MIVQLLLLILMIACCGVVIAHRDWRWQLSALALSFFIQFFLLVIRIPLIYAVILLILGSMSCAVIGSAKFVEPPEESRQIKTERVFRLASYLFFVVSALALAQRMIDWFPQIDYYLAATSLINIFSGLLVTGFSTQPNRIIPGLLLVLLGFESIYVSLELSLLVIGLMGAVKLGLAFIGSYWLVLTGEGGTD